MQSLNRNGVFCPGLKPELIGQLNQDGFTPIHIAAANGYSEIVKELLKVNRDYCRLTSRNGNTPLHYTAIRGRLDVISDLISSYGDLIDTITTCGETTFHLAVKNNQFEAFEVMIKKLK
ncbi:hypothetical protein IFM89_010088 [Coptis chinensis]|uniref:Uncharacterized protein n=1 Tax=Coptis chinensis TaxID=261450 RepID=A0A835LUE3_9MAGN|nr:hypothetical protein IFM89_010088 [Coptis chinensis]